MNDDAIIKILLMATDQAWAQQINGMLVDPPSPQCSVHAVHSMGEGLKTLKDDKVSVENVYSKMRRVFNHYTEQGELQRKQAYESLISEFETKLQQAVQQQLGASMRVRIDIEKQPQFQEEWRRVKTQLNSQYIKLLDESHINKISKDNIDK